MLKTEPTTMGEIADDLIKLAHLVRAGEVPMLAMSFQVGGQVSPRVIIVRGADFEVFKNGYYAIERMSDQLCELAACNGFREEMEEIEDAYTDMVEREINGKRALDS